MKLSNLLVALVLSATRIVAQGDFIPPQQQDSGFVGISSGQTARFTVLYPGIPFPAAQVAVPVTLIIDDDQGNTLAMQDFLLTGSKTGKVASIAVNADTVLPAGSRSLLIHAYTLIQGNATGKVPLVIPGLDIVDNASGKTVIHLETSVTFPANADHSVVGDEQTKSIVIKRSQSPRSCLTFDIVYLSS